MSSDDTNMPLIDVRPDHWAIVQSILQKHLPQCVVWAFGSRAKWTAKPYSDLDLAVICDQPLSLAASASLADDFSESDLPWKVDIVDWATTSDSFRSIIARDKVVVQSPNIALMKLEDCMSAIIDYRGKTPLKTDSGIPLVTAKIVKGGRIEEPTEFIALDDFDAWMTRGLPMRGDVVLTTEAPLGEVAQLDGRKVALAQRIITLRGKPGILDNTYLKFVLQGEFVQNQLQGRASGSTVSGIKQSELRKIDIPVPAFNEQLAIARVLGSIDDKIELNRRTNRTLEAMARALFRDWFIDFGPVRSKIEELPPYLAPEIWSLFPADANEDGLPKGWQEGKLSDIAQSRGEGVQPSSVNENTPYIGLEHMPRRSIALDAWEGAGKVSSNKSIFRRGDILFGKLRPYFHKVGVAPVDGICSTDIVVLREMDEAWTSFVRMCVSCSDFVAYTDKGATGTKMPRTNWTIMGGYKLTLPTKDIAKAYDKIVSPLFEIIISNTHENKALLSMRDLVMPKMMSGELRITNPREFLVESMP